MSKPLNRLMNICSLKWLLKRRRLILIAVILCVCFLVYQLLSLKELNVQMSGQILHMRSGVVDKHHSTSDDNNQDSNQIENSFNTYNEKTINGQKVIIIGVLPKFAALYQKTSDQFRCLSSGEHIPYLYLNDDYCDCEDGSDEPSTNACPNTKFYCKTSADKPQDFISSYKVNDRVCDCYDGTDEWSTKACPDRHH